MPCLTGRVLGPTVPHMSSGLRERAKGQNPLQLLILVLATLLTWASGGQAASEDRPQRTELAQADRLLPTGCAHIAPVDAPDQDDLETLSEQLEDPLVALGHHVIGLEAASEAEQTSHGLVRGWAVRAPIFRSSSARGPPLS